MFSGQDLNECQGSGGDAGEKYELRPRMRLEALLLGLLGFESIRAEIGDYYGECPSMSTDKYRNRIMKALFFRHLKG